MTVLSARSLGVLLGEWRTETGAAYQALADRIRLLVLDGRIALGTRLPAERDLAASLGVSRTTVSAAYADLRETGYVTSVRGSGSVARLPLHSALPVEPLAAELLDFSKATMPTSDVVASAAEHAAAQLPAYLGESGFDPLGLLVLREAIANRYTARGLPTDADQIMVTVGAQSAISLLARTVLARGDRALIENPSYPHGFDALKLAGARLVPVSVTADEGWDIDGLEQAVRRTSPALGYLMPDHHNPTGASMSHSDRERTIAIAERHGTQLVIDETMGELGIAPREPFEPFATLGPAILVGSVGKTVWGGLRLGWIRADRPLIQRLARARSATDLGTPILEQLIVAHVLGDYDAVLRDRTDYLRANHAHLAAELRGRFPTWRVTDAGGGLTLWVNLGAPVSSQLTLAARNEGLLLAAGPRFGLDGAFERFLRIPFCHPRPATERAVDALERAWSSVVRHPGPVPEDLLAEVV